MLRLPERLRKDLSKSYGKLYEGEGVELIKKIDEIKKSRYLACIGDLVCYYTLKAGIKPDIVIYDLKTERKELSTKLKEELLCLIKDYEIRRVKNQQGTISEELVYEIVYAVKNLGKRGVAIEVRGEEDLASLPLAYLMPEGSLVLYGIPSRGVSAYTVKKEEKPLILKLIEGMERDDEDEVILIIKREVSGWK